MSAPGLVAAHQRSTGSLRLSLKRRGEATVLDGLRQEGCLKARFPRADAGEWMGAVILNSAGGVAGGDRLVTSASAGLGTRVTIASQAAERFYRALPGSVAVVGNSVEIADGAALEWLPQETILFDRCALSRTLRVTLADDAVFLGVESLVFGRAAMGETVQRAALDDLIEIRRGGRLLLHDRIRFGGEVAPILARPAVAAGGTAVATLMLVTPDAQDRLEAVRDALAPYEAGASVMDGMLLARIVAENGGCLRRAVVAGLAVLREGRALPRVWLC